MSPVWFVFILNTEGPIFQNSNSQNTILSLKLLAFVIQWASENLLFVPLGWILSFRCL